LSLRTVRERCAVRELVPMRFAIVVFLGNGLRSDTSVAIFVSGEPPPTSLFVQPLPVPTSLNAVSGAYARVLLRASAMLLSRLWHSRIYSLALPGT